MHAVIHVPADQVGVWLTILGIAAVLSLVSAFAFRDDITLEPNRSLLSVAGMAAIGFITLLASA